MKKIDESVNLIRRQMTSIDINYVNFSQSTSINVNWRKLMSQYIIYFIYHFIDVNWR